MSLFSEELKARTAVPIGNLKDFGTQLLIIVMSEADYPKFIKKMSQLISEELR